MSLLSTLIILLTLVLGIGFSCVNTEMVTVNYYLGNLQIPLALLVAVALGVGICIGGLTGWLNALRLKWQNRVLRLEINALNTQLQNTRLKESKLDS